jgi:hypothetical protein
MVLTSRTRSCQFCLSWGEDSWPYRDHQRGGHRLNIAEVSDSAEDGCQGCEVIRRLVQPYMKLLEEPSSVVCLVFSQRRFRFTCACGTFTGPVMKVWANLEVKCLYGNEITTYVVHSCNTES